MSKRTAPSWRRGVRSCSWCSAARRRRQELGDRLFGQLRRASGQAAGLQPDRIRGKSDLPVDHAAGRIAEELGGLALDPDFLDGTVRVGQDHEILEAGRPVELAGQLCVSRIPLFRNPLPAPQVIGAVLGDRAEAEQPQPFGRQRQVGQSAAERGPVVVLQAPLVDVVQRVPRLGLQAKLFWGIESQGRDLGLPSHVGQGNQPVAPHAVPIHGRIGLRGRGGEKVLGRGEVVGVRLVHAEIELREVVGPHEPGLVGCDAGRIGELVGPETPADVAVLSAAGEQVIVVGHSRGTPRAFRVARADAALGRHALERAEVIPVAFQRGKAVSFAVEVHVEIGDHGQKRGLGAVLDEDRVGTSLPEQLAAPPVHVVQLDQAVVHLARMTVLLPEPAIRIGQVVVQVEAVDRVLVEHPRPGGLPVLGQAVG